MKTISTGSWGYTDNLVIKPAKDLLHVLIDIVSKNGVLLLNISPKSDGIIPENQQAALLKIGEWLGKYGEAIYDTRPWYTFGEGPTQQPEGDFKNHSDFKKVKYSEKDIRYTTQGKTIYAITLGIPEANQEIHLESFTSGKISGKLVIKSISVLGSEQPIQFQLKDDGLWFKTPEKIDDDMALVFKIETE